MVKYKLIKELPDHTIGRIETKEYWINWFGNHGLCHDNNYKTFLKEVKPYPDTDGVILEEMKGTRLEKHYSKHVKTLKELAEENDLKIGMKLSTELLYDWFEKCEGCPIFGIIDGTVEDFTISCRDVKLHPIFECNSYTFLLTGFKKFRQEWNRNKGSDLDIDNLKANTGKFKRGDKVVITRKAKDSEGDWNDDWVSDMDDNINKVVTIIKKDTIGGGYVIEEDTYDYPEFVMMDALEYAKLKYPIGTKFRRIDMPYVILTVDSLPYFDSNEDIRVNTDICDWPLNIKEGSANPKIYKKGKWAKTVEEDTPTLIVIDHFHLIKPLTKQRSEELTEFMKELKNKMKSWEKQEKN